MRNTYLTPLLYSGEAITLQFERIRLQQNLRFVNYQTADISYLTGEDKGHHGEAWAGRLRYRYGVLWTRHRSNEAARQSPWSFLLGPTLGADVGFDYPLKLAAANNPATVRVTAGLGVRGAVSYRFKQPACQGLCFSLSAAMPILGIALQPEYGASYYEVFYLDNTQNDLHLTSLHNQQDVEARFVADVPLALIPCLRRFDSRLRLGVDYRRETMDINHVTTRYNSLSFVIGWVYDYLPFGRHKSTFSSRPDCYEVF